MIHVQILGTGCPKCKTLFANAEAAVKAAGVEAVVEKVEDIQQIVKLGVMMTPGVVVDGKVASSGKVLSVDEIAALLTTAASGASAEAPAAAADTPAKPAACACAPGCGAAASPCRCRAGAKKAVALLLLGFVAASVAVVVSREIKAARSAPDAGAAVATPAAEGVLNVYYFHATRRCQTCTRIEALAREAVETKFAGEIADGRVVFKSLNMEEPGNTRFIEAFDLVSNTVVMQQGDAFEKFDAVWNHVGDPAAFHAYIQAGVAKFLEK
jgi:small redox-active disulfide protein 2